NNNNNNNNNNSSKSGGKRPRSPSPPATPPRNINSTHPNNSNINICTGRSKTPSPIRSSHSTEAKRDEIETTKTTKKTTKAKKTTVGIDAIPPQDDGKKTEASIWSQVEPFERITSNADFNSEHMFKFITWNVAGLRGLLRKDNRAIQKLLEAEQPDALCLQETKLNPNDPQNATLG
ncbi:apurinic/apyrimidinic endonuclease, partial [Trypanosoma theileri]